MYLQFKEKMSAYPVFSTKDIELQFPLLDGRRLTEWQQKGYIIKLRNTYYMFADQEDSEFLRYFISNSIYHPSYISLQSALNYHGYIPEASFNIFAISTLKTNIFSSPKGAYYYKNLKPEAFLGYQLHTQNNLTIKMASPEKALIDLIYLNKNLRDEFSLEELRLQKEKMKNEFSMEDFDLYASFYKSKVLDNMSIILKRMYA